MSYMKYSTRTAQFLTKKAGLPEEKEEILAYSIEVITLNTLNVFLVILLGLLLNVLKGTLICLITLSLIKYFAGGAHSNSPARCTIVTAILFPLMALLASKLTVLGQNFSDIIFLISIVTGLITVIILAPVDTEKAPIISIALRRKMKIISIIIILLLCIFTLSIRFYKVLNYTEIQLYIGLAVAWASFILTPLGHSFFKAIDRINIYLPKGGV